MYILSLSLLTTISSVRHWRVWTFRNGIEQSTIIFMVCLVSHFLYYCYQCLLKLKAVGIIFNRSHFLTNTEISFITLPFMCSIVLHAVELGVKFESFSLGYSHAKIQLFFFWQRDPFS